jgi:hypothetical protein
MTGSLAFDGAVGNAIGSLIRNRSLSRSGGNILRSGDAAEAQMMTDWLCRQGEFAVHMKRDPGECDSSIRSSNMVRHVASAADTERGV